MGRSKVIHLGTGIAIGMVLSALILVFGLYIISTRVVGPVDTSGLNRRVSAIERNLESNRVYPYGHPLYQDERPKNFALDAFGDPSVADPYR